MSDFSIKAANPDNNIEMRQIAHLFRLAYGDSFPIPRIYSPTFWHTHVGTRIISLVAKHNDRIFAHIGLHPDSDNTNNVQLAFTVCDPRFSQFIPEVGHATWNFIRQIAKRKQWQMLYYLIFGNVPEMQYFSSDIIGATEVAICPNYFPATSLRPRGVKLDKRIRKSVKVNRTPVLVTQKFFTEDPSPRKTLFVPEQHLSICKHIYDSLNLNRNFTTTSDNIGDLSENFIAVEKEHFSATEVQHLFVSPSRLDDFSSTLQIDSDLLGSLCCFVDMSDQKCPDFCEFLENNNFSFGGVFPYLRGRENILYCQNGKSKVNPECFYSVNAKRIAHYMLNSNKSKPTSFDYKSDLADAMAI